VSEPTGLAEQPRIKNLLTWSQGTTWAKQWQKGLKRKAEPVSTDRKCHPQLRLWQMAAHRFDGAVLHCHQWQQYTPTIRRCKPLAVSATEHQRRIPGPALSNEKLHRKYKDVSG